MNSPNAISCDKCSHAFGDDLSPYIVEVKNGVEVEYQNDNPPIVKKNVEKLPL